MHREMEPASETGISALMASKPRLETWKTGSSSLAQLLRWKLQEDKLWWPTTSTWTRCLTLNSNEASLRCRFHLSATTVNGTC